ncbi:MAG: hypothetical protein HQM10_14850 [Candidatus Riflebacteria bacterium]|nr:hypothetical protein [Candidatus Riflebacteria bacterium]
MKRIIFMISVTAFLTYFCPGKALLESKKVMQESDDPSQQEFDFPLPPLEGRKSERGLSSWLIKPEIGWKTWINRGKMFFRKHEYEQSILAFRKALRMKPSSSESHFFLGTSYQARGEQGLPGDRTSWEQLAEKEFLAAIHLGDFLPARYNVALLLERQGRLPEARIHLEHIVNVSPRSDIGKKALKILNENFDADLYPKMLTKRIPGSEDAEDMLKEPDYGNNAELLGSVP